VELGRAHQLWAFYLLDLPPVVTWQLEALPVTWVASCVLKSLPVEGWGRAPLEGWGKALLEGWGMALLEALFLCV
jgi:hypothetical protein